MKSDKTVFPLIVVFSLAVLKVTVSLGRKMAFITDDISYDQNRT